MESTGSAAGGVLLYINKRHSHKTCSCIAIHKAKKLESRFIEIILPNKSTFILGYIYKHSCMNICIFNDHYQNILLKKQISQ